MTLKPDVLRDGTTSVFFCFIELVLLKPAMLVQFMTQQCIDVVIRLDSVSHFRWLNSYLNRAEQYADIMM